MRSPRHIAVAMFAAAVALVVAWYVFAPTKTPNMGGVDRSGESSGNLPPLLDLITGAEPLAGVEQIAERVRGSPLIYAADRTAVAAAASEADIARGVEHVAKAVWLRFGAGDVAEYVRWRIDYGYIAPTVERLARNPVLRGSLRRQAGVGTDGEDPPDLTTAIWKHTIATRPPVKGISVAPGSHALAVGLLSKPITHDTVLGQTTAFPGLVMRSVDAPPALAAQAHRPDGQGWPFWLPPAEVQKRIFQTGVPVLEVVVTLTSADSGGGPADRTDSLGTLVALDRVTRKWWVVQFWIYNVRPGGGVNGALF